MPALSVHPGVQPAVMVSDRRVTALTPDGRLWLYGYDPSPLAFDSEGGFARLDAIRQFDEHHQWVSFGATDNELYAVRSDGTLWHWGQAFEPDPTAQVACAQGESS